MTICKSFDHWLEQLGCAPFFQNFQYFMFSEQRRRFSSGKRCPTSSIQCSRRFNQVVSSSFCACRWCHSWWRWHCWCRWCRRVTHIRRLWCQPNAVAGAYGCVQRCRLEVDSTIMWECHTYRVYIYTVYINAHIECMLQKRQLNIESTGKYWPIQYNNTIQSSYGLKRLQLV